MAVNKFIKYSLFLFNFLFWISGCILLGVGIWLRVTKDSNKLTEQAVPGIDLLIAVGVIVMMLGFLGCCGAVQESRCMLLLFFIGLLLIFILLLAAGILGAVGEDKVKDWIKENLEKMLPLSSQPQDVQSDLQLLEEKSKCCGLINGPNDWGSSIPASCNCTDTSAACVKTETRLVYQTPCVTVVGDIMKKQMTVVIGIAFAIAVVMIFGMAFSMILFCQIGRKEASTT
ncbi:tetraspanin-8 [Lepisosteus oculatus]|uniref:tetraspanin-8 n=1 Tax=Lepisosteus oculatus TaxID=7918 RepID=UPI00371F8CB0